MDQQYFANIGASSPPWCYPQFPLQQDATPYSPWRISPLRLSPAVRLPSPASMPSPSMPSPAWSATSPLMRSPAWPIASPARLLSPWRLNLGLRLGDQAANNDIQNAHHSLNQRPLDTVSGNQIMQPQIVNMVNTPSGSFVVPSSNNVASRLATSATPEYQAAPRVLAAKQLPTPAPPRSRVSKREWNAHRGQIQKLWLEEDRSLEETMRFMTERFNFSPS